MRWLKKIVRATAMFFLNNMLVNWLIILLGIEKKLKRLYNPYLSFRPADNKTLQETAGFSERPEINEALKKFHHDIQALAQKHFPQGGKVLDIGCGPGLYLKDFDRRYSLFATDINPYMVSIAREQVPGAAIYQGDFMDVRLNEKYHFVYCVGVLIFINRSELADFFKKIAQHMEQGAVLYLNYPHAISRTDLYYPDLSYIRYSPAVVESAASPYFEVLEHIQAIDGRIIRSYDSTPYPSLNPAVKQTIRNSTSFIARKR